MTRTTPDSVFTTWRSAEGTIQAGVFTIMHDLKDSNITVQWYFSQKLDWYPWDRFGSLANDKVLGPVMERSFDKLKKILEAK
jgi:hypothetical protein